MLKWLTTALFSCSFFFFNVSPKGHKIHHLKRENDVFLVQRENSHFREPIGMEINGIGHLQS